MQKAILKRKKQSLALLHVYVMRDKIRNGNPLWRPLLSYVKKANFISDFFPRVFTIPLTICFTPLPWTLCISFSYSFCSIFLHDFLYVLLSCFHSFRFTLLSLLSRPFTQIFFVIFMFPVTRPAPLHPRASIFILIYTSIILSLAPSFFPSLCLSSQSFIKIKYTFVCTIPAFMVVIHY